MRSTTARTLTAVFAVLVMLVQGTRVLAGTTGSLNGTVVDAQSGSPLGGARVTVSSPSQQASETTDPQGRFAFLSLAPDTYTLTITQSGYAPVTQAGITIQADNVVNQSFRATRQLQRIGGTTARANTDIVKPGTTTDVYSVNASQAAAAAGLGGGGALNQAYSAIASVPGVFIPQGQSGWAQSVFVRGGNYTQLGYEYDGVPVQRAYDAYPSSTLSALGQQEVQVYTGSQPGSAQSSGLAGFVNQVIKTGTYPGYGAGEVGLGAPSFYHKLQFELGGATPDRGFSYYVGAAGYNQATRILDQFDGGYGTSQQYSTIPYAAIAQNCGGLQATAGCYANGFGAAPFGYQWLPVSYENDQFFGDREAVANVHIGIPHKRSGTKDDVQFLADVSNLFQNFTDSLNGLGPNAAGFLQSEAAGNGVLNVPGGSYPGCDVAAAGAPCAVPINILPGRVFGGSFVYPSRSIYVGPTGSALTAADLGQVAQYTFPNQPYGAPPIGASSGAPFATLLDPNVVGNSQVNDAIFKLQYTHALGTNGYARLYGYSLYSSWLNNDPNSFSNANLATVSADYILPTHTRGIGLTLADQLGNHLLNLTGGYSYANISRWNNSFPSTANPVAVLVDSTNPTGGCYAYGGTALAAPAPCTEASRYTVPGTNQDPASGLVGRGGAGPSGITVGNAGTVTCGSGPCEFLAVGSGLNGSFNDVTPRFANLTLSDTWNVTPKLTLDLGIRYDSFRYDLPGATVPQGPNPPGTASAIGRTLFTNSYNQFHCLAGTVVIETMTPNACPAGTSQVTFTNDTPSAFWYGGFQPRLGATFQINNLNVLRAGYGRFLQPTNSSYLFYNRAGADVAGYDVPFFYPYGFTSPAHDVAPQESWNFDFSWEHQLRGSDVSFKLTPFLRRTRNENITVILDPTTGFGSGIDALSSNIRGFEVLLRKGDFNRNGVAAQLAYTYTYVTSRFQTLPGGTNVLAGVNTAVKQYNAYTSFCAAHPGDARCGSTSTGLPAAPCYTTAGAPDATCASGSIANPYWNAPVQALFDSGADYAPYNQTFGTGFSSNASSYTIPHVATLVVNYKHNALTLTPTVQFSAGGRYGSPVQGIAMDPAGGGCTPIPGGAIAGDPRYPYGAPGGAPYLAQTCAGFMTGPDPFTGRFDAPGAFTEPSQLLANLGVGYQINKRLRLNALAVNLFGTCWGGSREPWTNYGPKTGCWYSSGTGFQAGNFYNPGNTLANQAYPYFPAIGQINGQQVYGTNVQPFQLFVSAQFKM